MIKRFQNKIAESRFALIATILLCLPAWLVSAWYMLAYGSCLIPEQSSPTHSLSPLTPHPTFNVQHSTSYVLLWGLLTLISVFLIAELNNRNALIRIYSRMVSSCFLVMATTLTITHWSAERNVVTLATSLLFYLLFLTYQDRKATGKVYYAFVSLSVASIFFPQILFFVPLLWLLMGTRLLSLSVILRIHIRTHHAILDNPRIQGMGIVCRRHRHPHPHQDFLHRICGRHRPVPLTHTILLFHFRTAIILSLFNITYSPVCAAHTMRYHRYRPLFPYQAARPHQDAATL